MGKEFTTPMGQIYRSPHVRITDVLVDTDLNEDATNSVEIFHADGEDVKIPSVKLFAVGQTGIARAILYKFDGTTYEPMKDFRVIAITPSASVNAFEGLFNLGSFVLENGMKLFVGLEGAIEDDIAVHVNAVEYKTVV